jgi:hypothetical protein
VIMVMAMVMMMVMVMVMKMVSAQAPYSVKIVLQCCYSGVTEVLC